MLSFWQRPSKIGAIHVVSGKRAKKIIQNHTITLHKNFSFHSIMLKKQLRSIESEKQTLDQSVSSMRVELDQIKNKNAQYVLQFVFSY